MPNITLARRQFDPTNAKPLRRTEGEDQWWVRVLLPGRPRQPNFNGIDARAP
jgi:hypothetical protein